MGDRKETIYIVIKDSIAQDALVKDYPNWPLIKYSQCECKNSFPW